MKREAPTTNYHVRRKRQPFGNDVSTQPQETPTKRAAAKHSRAEHYLNQHRNAFTASIRRLINNKFSTLITLLVIAIALALPTGLYLLLQNVESLSDTWDNSAQISLYLDVKTPPSAVQALEQRLQAMPEVASVHYISPQEGLREFIKSSGFDEALSTLDSNPLPGVITVVPQLGERTAQQLQHLLQRLEQLPNVSMVQMDMAWIKRLQAIIRLGERGVFALALLFGVGVLLIIGNTINLAMQRFRDEIEIVKLVGGTDAFVRRPFLYCGILYGLGGALLAWAMVAGFLWWLKTPIDHLATLYGSHYDLAGFNADNLLVLLSGAIILGLFGARLAVRRYLVRL